MATLPEAERETSTATIGLVAESAQRTSNVAVDVAARVAVVTLNYNGLDDTFKCLESLRGVDGENWRVYVVENGSKPGEADAIAEVHEWVDVVPLECNVGWAGGNNAGIRRALADGAEHVILLNNDTTVDPQLVNRLRLAAASHQEFGVLGPVVCCMDDPDKVNVDGCVFNDPHDPGFFRRQPIPWCSDEQPRVTETEIVNGCCMMIRADVFAAIGLIDEQFFLVHEESEFCLRARRAGFRCGILGEALVWHKGSSYYQREPRPLQSYYDARNLFLILKKHAAGYANGDPRWRAWLKYLKHVYYMYCIQRDRGNAAGARAVLDGLSDALTGYFGAMRPRARPGVALMDTVFGGYRTWSMLRDRSGASNGWARR